MTIHPVSAPFDVDVHNEAGRATARPQPGAPDPVYWGEDGFRFDDVLDAINPLHHLPVVGTLYREATGDQIAPGARLLGGLLFGGPIGLVLAIANAIFEEATGRDVGGAVVALLSGEDEPAPADGGQLAAADTSAAPPPPAAPDEAAPAPDEPPTAAAADVPELSPQAFAALMRAFDNPPAAPVAPPAAAPAPRPVRAGMQAGPEIPAALPPLAPLGGRTPLLRRAGEGEDAPTDRRQAALDLHQHLRAFAEQKGVRIAGRAP